MDSKTNVQYLVKVVKGISKEIESDVAKFIEIFLRNDAAAIAFGVAQQESISETFVKAIRTYLINGWNSMCIEKSTQQIIGWQTGILKGVTNVLEPVLESGSLATENEQELARFWMFLENFPDGNNDQSETISLIFSVTVPEYNNKGISTALGRGIIRLAKMIGIKKLRAECTSKYNSNVLVRVSKPNASTLLTDYRDSKGRVIFTDTNSTHNRVDIYIILVEDIITKMEEERGHRGWVEIIHDDELTADLYLGVNHLHELPEFASSSP